MQIMNLHVTTIKYLRLLATFFLAVICICCQLNEKIEPSQKSTFVKYLGTHQYQKAYSAIINDSDNSMILVGEIEAADSRDIYLIKTDANGNYLNEAVYRGGTGQDDFSPVMTKSIVPNDGYLLVYERKESAIKSSLVISKIGEDIDQEDWTNDTTMTKSFTYTPKHVLATSDSGYLISGTTTLPSRGSTEDTVVTNAGSQGFVVKINSQGLKEWQCFFGKQGSDEAIKTFETKDEGSKYIIVFNSDEDGVEFGTITEEKNTNLGDLTATLQIKEAKGMDVAWNGDDEFYVLCSNVNSINSQFGIARVKYNPSNESQPFSVNKAFSVPERESPSTQKNIGYSLQLKGDYLFVSGAKAAGLGEEDYLLSKVEISGPKLIWEKNYGSPFKDEAYKILIAPDNGIILLGYMTLLNESTRMMGLIKVDSEGNFKNE